ncbi:hypothetical protein [Wolinella succinogenes]|uniref:hypothetical protein n=1 Tax=Wolinella succinogenes TaxID=844 RepID=UPI0013ECE4D8|nr:hypothetical protein [Wolinella succinogenes]
MIHAITMALTQAPISLSPTLILKILNPLLWNDYISFHQRIEGTLNAPRPRLSRL